VRRSWRRSGQELANCEVKTMTRRCWTRPMGSRWEAQGSPTPCILAARMQGVLCVQGRIARFCVFLVKLEALYCEQATPDTSHDLFLSFHLWKSIRRMSQWSKDATHDGQDALVVLTLTRRIVTAPGGASAFAPAPVTVTAAASWLRRAMRVDNDTWRSRRDLPGFTSGSTRTPRAGGTLHAEAATHGLSPRRPFIFESRREDSPRDNEPHGKQHLMC